MAKITIILEDTIGGVSLDIRNDRPSHMRDLIRQSPAQRLGEQLHDLAMLEMRLASIPAHRKQFSNTYH
ncbi:hypothetical protein P3W55_01915 [Pseudomonas citronellolis]|uniref:DUF3509 domain-containing protein n=1 Tax=Pseudomonas citronellolis TaxID=53408 RepID=A0AAW6P258_9PSED|nr:hypothetical protein [Pseudomonas citronellolis]MDF3840461.1 hypothetical protein [Pseudomonas citronellolis]WRT82966.1 hypothetical protein VK748_00580 [Pseudomonas citronellolis]